MLAARSSLHKVTPANERTCTAREPDFIFRAGLSHHGSVGDSRRAKHSAVARDFLRRTERLGVVVGKLHGGPAFNGGDLADQADRIKTGAVVGIAAAKVVGEQRPPTRAEAYAASVGPLGAVVKIGGALKIGSD